MEPVRERPLKKLKTLPAEAPAAAEQVLKLKLLRWGFKAFKALKRWRERGRGDPEVMVIGGVGVRLKRLGVGMSGV